MKKFIILLLLVVVFSCRKEIVVHDNAKLWVSIDNSIVDLQLSFITIDKAGILHSSEFIYDHHMFNPHIQVLKYGSRTWILLADTQSYCNEITVVYNNKIYKTKGFFLGERRFLEIVPKDNGDVNLVNTDITTIDQIVYIN